MDVTYYPDLYVYDEQLLKALVLTWGKVQTVVPPSERRFITAYLAGEVKGETHAWLERYKRIYDATGAQTLDFWSSLMTNAALRVNQC